MTTMRGVWIVGVVVFALATAGVAAASEPPQAEAGLDQEAVVNQTVYLDAGGSLDPDGRIADYAWSIETPGGNTTAPDCPSCAQTHFVPREDGTYAVTMTVTDDEGASMADTMYVTVSESRAPKSLNNSSSSTTVVRSSQPDVSSGGGRGGMAPDPSRIMRADGGDYVLRTGAGSSGAFIMMVGGTEVKVPAWRMEVAAMDGQVEYSEVSRYFENAGATRDDIRHELQNSRASCGGNTCTAMVGETSGEPSEGQGKPVKERIEQNLEESLGCTSACGAPTSTTTTTTTVTTSTTTTGGGYGNVDIGFGGGGSSTGTDGLDIPTNINI